jgi:hypothetical protein
MGFLKWFKSAAKKDVCQPKPSELLLSPEYFEYFDSLETQYKQYLEGCFEYHTMSFKIISPFEENILKKLYTEVESWVGWARYTTESGYPGKKLRNQILKETTKLGFSIDLLPICFALIPFYQFPDAKEYKRQWPFQDEERRGLFVGLSALLTNEELAVAVKNQLTKILIDYLSFSFFEGKVSRLNRELEEKHGKNTWRRFGLYEKICDPVTPFSFRKPKHLLIHLPEVSEVVFSLGHLRDTNAIPVLREVRKWNPDKLKYSGYDPLIVLCKLNCHEELEELKALVFSGKTSRLELNDIITCVAQALAFNSEIIELITYLARESSEASVKSNAELTLKYYRYYMMEREGRGKE